MATNVNEAFSYLRGRGYFVEQGGFPSGIGIAVNGKLLTDYQVCVLATYESCKDEDCKPDGLGLAYMADACLKIAEHSSLHSLAADEGRELAKRLKEWKNSSETDFPLAQLKVLCKRMAHFLTREFAYLW
jgi:hypothetical protein